MAEKSFPREMVLAQLQVMEDAIDGLIVNMWDGEAIDTEQLGIARKHFTDAFRSWKRAVT